MISRLSLLLLSFRAFNGIFVETYFDPDEYWQCLEVAHCLAFGKCHLTWEWQQGVRLRGFAHPFVFGMFYKVCAWLSLDSRDVIAYGPRVIGGLFAAIGDMAVYRLGYRLFGQRGGMLCLFCNVMNWFYFYTTVRTYSNSMEAVLTVVALSYWPMPNEKPLARQRLLGLVFAALAVLVRPTAGLFWIYPGVSLLLGKTQSLRDRAYLVFGQVLPVGIGCVVTMVLVDWYGYGEWTFVPYNFLKSNLLEGVSDEYGIHVRHWYFTECFPAIIGTWLPFFVYGVVVGWRERSKVMFLAKFVVIGLCLLSVSAHKELRFALPLVPPASVVCGFGLYRSNLGTFRSKFYIAFSCLANIAVAVFLSRYHQRGPIPLLEFLSASSSNATFVDFYTRCHATPYWSHIHNTTITRMRFLDCSPNVKALEKIPSMSMSFRDGIEEEDLFFKSPRKFLLKRFSGENTELPSHMVFTTEKTSNEDLLFVQKEFNYAICKTFPHTFDVAYVVLCKNVIY
mmetsp:Transcript_4571/g.6817  ORF Transcript_4571/g.6817 Transcript_4571/m.6817 type:complete len:507 (-) Transcript_4571:969-2489(-)